MTGTSTATVDSPVGPLLLAATADGLTDIRFAGDAGPAPADSLTGEAAARARSILAAAAAQLAEYFAGERRTFDLPLAFAGTPFQRDVWRALQSIPHGETISYAELARRVGRPRAVRAVGAANGRNPLPIVLPCHRVIGADGSLTGYGGGLAIKRTLLDLEARAAGRRG
ncbi:MAG TPA: methylated-DNA--[protein]-cysteine S-methyltransferase [Candidatus Krumholzibacteria bacterium]|nr:methylated-DNA--[protein]-cysteine S-methyltransferase [Candidatus Krumholzibacteria bacterium]HPD72517.1 methylated-DNA--[protein]-cysteine S-methyltransferase [Candidatus Krumholzibacteria bacterium]HRY40551.1 methylated-DNA--[protein]-cysteine S-methyltransferase [Candidatus Krumholzibacteria bacterium]